MDDLFPFLVFIVIALINLVKFVAEKKAKDSPSAPNEKPAKSAPSTIENFFEQLATRLEPQPTPVPDWPEGYEQPDYVGEQEEYEAAQEEAFVPEPVAEIIPMPVREKPTVPPAEIHTASLQSTMSSIPGIASGIGSMQMPSSPMMKSGAGGTINYSLKSKAALRKAIIANIIFSTPRACNPSFDNTIAK